MTRLALSALLLMISTSLANAQPPKSVTELEGTWRVPESKGELHVIPYSITFAGEKVTIEVFGEVMRGTFRIERTDFEAAIHVAITVVDGREVAPQRKHIGKYWLLGGELRLRMEELEIKIEPPKLPTFEWKDAPPEKTDLETLRKYFEQSQARMKELEVLMKEYNARLDEYLAAIRGPQLLGRAPITYRLEKVKK